MFDDSLKIEFSAAKTFLLRAFIDGVVYINPSEIEKKNTHKNKTIKSGGNKYEYCIKIKRENE